MVIGPASDGGMAGDSMRCDSDSGLMAKGDKFYRSGGDGNKDSGEGDNGDGGSDCVWVKVLLVMMVRVITAAVAQGEGAH